MLPNFDLEKFGKKSFFEKVLNRIHEAGFFILTDVQKSIILAESDKIFFD